MDLVVVGMGYVGIPVAASFAKAGLRVVGLDIDEAKVEALNAGIYPIQGDEPGMKELVAATVADGAFSASTDAACVAKADAVIVCIQTPFDVEAMEARYVALRSGLESVAPHLRPGALLVIESTLAPGTMESVVEPILTDAGADVLLGHCPERVMPGKLLHNLRTYDRVMGGRDEASRAAMRKLYSHIVEGELHEADMRTAEVVKSFENTYRDVEIALANEFARYCDVVGVDFHRIRELVNRVESRNLHVAGTGVGGHCIPKDTYLLAYGAKGRFTPELMLHARKVNDAMPVYVADQALRLMKEEGKTGTVAVLGLAYLGDSDDTRHSPTVPLVHRLREAGCTVRVHDPYGGRDEDVEAETDLEACVKGADAIIIAVAHSAYRLGAPWYMRHAPILIDGRRVVGRDAAEAAGLQYYGVGEGA